MEIKKSPKADLEGNKITFTLIGFVVILAIILVAFEWTTSDAKVYNDNGIVDGLVEDDIVPITMQETPPPPPPPPAPVIEQIINIVENNTEVAHVEILSTEDDQKKEQKIVFAPPPPAAVEDPEENVVFTLVEKSPQFPGGDAAMMKFINANIKYPVVAAESGIQGRVFCQFTVNKDGKIVDAVVVRGVDASLDKEALRVVNAMPAWSPGEQRGKKVRVRYSLPISFRLQ